MKSIAYSPVRRTIALLLLILLVGTTWGRSRLIQRDPVLSMTFRPIPVRDRADYQAHLGAFRFEAAWRMVSPSTNFGSYSALLAMPDRRFLAISDDGMFLRFAAPNDSRAGIVAGPILAGGKRDKSDRDIESATRDPHTGNIWIALEGTNAVYMLRSDLRTVRMRRPQAIAGWGVNSGPEAMTRMADGRFVLLREAFTGMLERQHHDAAIFEGDPTYNGPMPPVRSWHFVFDGPAGFSPTDMAQMPDGRLLILMRRLIWPMPQRFAGRLAIGDPRDIRPGRVWKVRQVARLASSMPVDNFEGIAVVPGRNGRLTVWLISDDNFSALQSTVLWKLSVDPRQLP